MRDVGFCKCFTIKTIVPKARRTHLKSSPAVRRQGGRPTRNREHTRAGGAVRCKYVHFQGLLEGLVFRRRRLPPFTPLGRIFSLDNKGLTKISCQNPAPVGVLYVRRNRRWSKLASFPQTNSQQQKTAGCVWHRWIGFVLRIESIMKSGVYPRNWVHFANSCHTVQPDPPEFTLVHLLYNCPKA